MKGCARLAALKSRPHEGLRLPGSPKGLSARLRLRGLSPPAWQP